MKKYFVKVLYIILIVTVLGLASAFSAEAIDLSAPASSMKLDYAAQFSVSYYEEGYKLLVLGGEQRFLLIPENASIPVDLPVDVVPLRQPVHSIYLAATAVMCLFDALDGLDAIRLSGTKEDGWYIEGARKAMKDGRILYAGKYSEPDYELLLANQCSIAIESQMINHTPEVKEKLEELGIPVLIDRSSSESHPLARTEWIRFYGALLNKEELAEELFRNEVTYLNSAVSKGSTGKTAVFFHISSSGLVVVRKSGDYVSKMIELAGGKYVFDNIGDPEKSTSTVTIDMESFFAAAKDADVIIYNSTIAGEVNSLTALAEKNELLKELKAFKNGNVWCTHQNMYQDTTHIGQMIQNLSLIFSGETDTLENIPYFYRLK